MLPKRSPEDFYPRNKNDPTAPLFLLFDDVLPGRGSLGCGEFLRLLSIRQRTINIKGSTLSGEELKSVIVLSNSEMSEWVECYNKFARAAGKGAVPFSALKRRFEKS